jgi:hypothetical protein
LILNLVSSQYMKRCHMKLIWLWYVSFCCSLAPCTSQEEVLSSLSIFLFVVDLYWLFAWFASYFLLLTKKMIHFVVNWWLWHLMCSVYIEDLMSVRNAINFWQTKVLVMVLTALMTQAHPSTIHLHCLVFQRFLLTLCFIVFYTSACIWLYLKQSSGQLKPAWTGSAASLPAKLLN